MAVKPYWVEAFHSAEYLKKSWFIPHDIAINPNNHFYLGDVEAFIENFDLIAFLHSPDDKTQIVFRFWTVNEQLLNRSWPWDLFTGQGVGSLSLEQKSLKELIDLVDHHTRDLIDVPEPAPIFEPIPYRKLYRHTALSAGELPDMVTFLRCSGLYTSKMNLKTIQASRHITYRDEKDFDRASDNSNGALTLTRRGGEEFCGILRKYLWA